MTAVKLNGAAPKLEPARERFVQEYHATGNASEALRRAYPNACKWKEGSVNVRASRLLADAKVLLRLEQLQAEAAARHNITVDSITEMLKEDREKAHAAGQIGAAVSASMGLAKLHGLIVDKAEVKRTDSGDIASITTNELEAIVRAGRAGAAEAAKSARKPDSVH
jgi:phage terminase small subunit